MLRLGRRSSAELPLVALRAVDHYRLGPRGPARLPVPVIPPLFAVYRSKATLSVIDSPRPSSVIDPPALKMTTLIT